MKKEAVNNTLSLFTASSSFLNLCCFMLFYQLRMILAMRTPKK